MNNQTTNRTWIRFKKNKAGIISLVFIICMIIIAVFCYVIAPDNTTDANSINLEIATQKPGYSCLFFKKYKKDFKPNFTRWHQWFYGKESDAELIPIKEAKLNNDSMYIAHILDNETIEWQSFALDKSIKNPIKHYTFKRTFWLGTDKYGRDMLSRLIIGTRISLSVGFIAVFISIFIGVLLGSISAYFAGITDMAVTWLINVIWAIPTLLLVFAITAVLGKSFWLIFIAVGFTMWVGTARLIRGQVMSIKELEYIQVARTMGFSSMRIISKHIIPNILGPTIVMAAANFATAILIEAGLSFLGIGVQPPASSWGLMIKENYNFIITDRPMLAIIPGIAIMLIVLAFNLLGNALRDALDVKGSIN